jgi:hypothetical protein
LKISSLFKKALAIEGGDAKKKPLNRAALGAE